MGPDHMNDRCTATAKSTGDRCRRAPVPGARVCRMHGGAAPQVARKAAERLAANEALAALARRGVAPVENPLAALAELAGEVLGVKDILRERVTRLEEERWRYSDDKGRSESRCHHKIAGREVSSPRTWG